MVYTKVQGSTKSRGRSANQLYSQPQCPCHLRQEYDDGPADLIDYLQQVDPDSITYCEVEVRYPNGRTEFYRPGQAKSAPEWCDCCWSYDCDCYPVEIGHGGRYCLNSVPSQASSVKSPKGFSQASHQRFLTNFAAAIKIQEDNVKALQRNLTLQTQVLHSLQRCLGMCTDEKDSQTISAETRAQLMTRLDQGRDLAKNLIESGTKSSASQSQRAANILDWGETAKPTSTGTVKDSQSGQPMAETFSRMFQSGYQFGRDLGQAISPSESSTTPEPRGRLYPDILADENLINFLATEAAKLFTALVNVHKFDRDSTLALIKVLATAGGPRMEQFYSKFADKVAEASTTRLLTAKDILAARAKKLVDSATTGASVPVKSTPLTKTTVVTDNDDFSDDDDQIKPISRPFRVIGHDDPTRNSGNFEIELDDFSATGSHQTKLNKAKAKAVVEESDDDEATVTTRAQIKTMADEIIAILKANPFTVLALMAEPNAAAKFFRTIKNYFFEHNLTVKEGLSWDQLVDLAGDELRPMLSLFFNQETLKSTLATAVKDNLAYALTVASLPAQQRQEIYQAVLKSVSPRLTESVNEAMKPASSNIKSTTEPTTAKVGQQGFSFNQRSRYSVDESPGNLVNDLMGHVSSFITQQSKKIKADSQVLDAPVKPVTEIAAPAKPEGSVESEPDDSDDLFEL